MLSFRTVSNMFYGLRGAPVLLRSVSGRPRARRSARSAGAADRDLPSVPGEEMKTCRGAFNVSCTSAPGLVSTWCGTFWSCSREFLAFSAGAADRDLPDRVDRGEEMKTCRGAFNVSCTSAPRLVSTWCGTFWASLVVF